MTEWDLSPDEALHHLFQWQHATTIMEARVRDPAADTFTMQGDAYLFAMAARQALRFAQLVRRVAQPSFHSEIDRALGEFVTTAPDIKAIRDVLDHFDEYLRGTGRDYPASPPPTYQRELGQTVGPTLVFYQRSEETVRLHVSPAPGVKLILDVALVAAAVSTLAYALADILDPQ